VYEINQTQVARVAGQIPDPIDAVMRLFDGTRTVADVVEDSAFRMIETLRMGDRLCELGLIQLSRSPGSHDKTHTALAIDEWRGGGDQKDGAGAGAGDVTARKSERPEAAVAPGRGRKRRKRRRRRNEGAGAQATAAAPASAAALGSGDPLVIDWERLLPQPVGTADAGMSPVVPSTAAAGEIAVSSAPPVPPPARERIVDVMSADKLVQLFSGDRDAEADGASTDSQRGIDPDDISTEPLPKLEEAVATDPELALETAGEIDTAPPVAVGATQFSADEEAFFAEGAELADQVAPDESFDDLEEAQPPPQSFWRRLFGGGKKPARP
jgi:hypothetical protein